jgi:hypothetical protein
MKINNMRQMPRTEKYIWGWDMALSGWGEFADPNNPNETLSYVDRGVSKWKAPTRSLCPVVFPLYQGTDISTVRLNVSVCDIWYEGEVYRGKPKRTPKGGWKAWAREFKRENDEIYSHSIIYGVLASMWAENYARSGLHRLMHWWLKIHEMPFVTVRTKDTRWYTEPGLGQIFYDEDERPFKYAHPGDTARGNDWVLRKGRVTQLGPRSRSRFPKVFPALLREE